MTSSVKNIYESHHKTSREEGFSILKDERGNFLKKIIGEGKEVLDIGCRDGALTSFFSKDNIVLGVDIDEISLLKAKERLGIETLSFDLLGGWEKLSQRKFDVVVAGEVLEHVYYPDKVTQKVKTHLKKGGIFVGSVPNAFSLINRLRYLKASKKYTPLSDPTHINHFSAHQLRDMLQPHFSSVEIVGMGRLGFLARVFPQWFAFDLFFIAKDE